MFYCFIYITAYYTNCFITTASNVTPTMEFACSYMGFSSCTAKACNSNILISISMNCRGYNCDIPIKDKPKCIAYTIVKMGLDFTKATIDMSDTPIQVMFITIVYITPHFDTSIECVIV